MLVRSDRQRRGIGRALLREAIQAARQEGVKRLEAYVHPDNLKVHRAFQKWCQAKALREGTLRKTFREGEVVYALEMAAREERSKTEPSSHAV